MAKRSSKKIAGIPKSIFFVVLIGVAAFVGFYVYRKRGQRQAMRAWRRAAIARRPR